MASCVLQKTSMSEAYDFQDTVTYQYRVTFDASISNPLAARLIAQSLGPNPLPSRRAQLSGSFLFVQTVECVGVSSQQKVWDFTVQFGKPPQGDDGNQGGDNPLLRPAIYNVEYIEEEYVVKEARNITELTGGFTRPVGTLGPIVNAAFRRPDEPIVRTRRAGVIQIYRNLPDLGVVMDRNEDFQDTCNSDSITLGTKTFEARRLKFEVCASQGLQNENDVVFYPSITEIKILKTTDLILDNVGYEYWDAAQNGYVRSKDANGDDTAEPINLNLDGTKKTTGVIGDTGPITITYRDLEEVPYAGFFE